MKNTINSLPYTDREREIIIPNKDQLPPSKLNFQILAEQQSVCLTLALFEK
jgi:hypothetical protein